jgi:hypothetical protein
MGRQRIETCSMPPGRAEQRLNRVVIKHALEAFQIVFWAGGLGDSVHVDLLRSNRLFDIICLRI